MDISTAAAPKSDQLNADDLISGPQLVTIAEVRKGSDEQPVEIVTTEFGPGRPYRPGKSMIRVLIAAWGKEASEYTGRRLMLYRDPEIRFGKDAVGGIRISAMSDIKSRLVLALTVTRGKRAPFVVDPLPDAPPPASKQPTPAGIIKAFESFGVTVEQLELRVGADSDKWTADDIAALAALGKAIKAGTTTTFEEFETGGAKEAGQQELTATTTEDMA
jgi:hypothetical protein